MIDAQTLRRSSVRKRERAAVERHRLSEARRQAASKLVAASSCHALGEKKRSGKACLQRKLEKKEQASKQASNLSNHF